MAFIPLPQGIRVSMEWTIGGQTIVNVHWVTKDGAIPVLETDLDTILSAFDALRTGLRGSQNAGQVATRIHAQAWDVEDGVSKEFTTFVNPAGGSASAALPYNVAIVMSKKTARSGRSYQGRTYHGATVQASITGGELVTATYASALAALYQTLKTTLNGAGFQWVVASFEQNKAPLLLGVATKITTLIIDQPTDSQRRRLIGRGA